MTDTLERDDLPSELSIGEAVRNVLDGTEEAKRLTEAALAESLRRLSRMRGASRGQPRRSRTDGSGPGSM